MSTVRFLAVARTLIVGASVISIACSSTTDDGDAAADLHGAWNYSAAQTGTAVLLEGTFVIDERTGAVFTGQFNGRVRDAQGVITNITGIASGRTFGDDAVDFDLIVNGNERRHVGRIARADSIGGTWAQQSGAAPVSGSFILTRP